MDDVTGDSPTLDPALEHVGTVIAGRYRLRSTLGHGATKVVYLAHDERLDREVALAIVTTAGRSPAARERVVREAQVTGRLGDHPNVVTVHDAGDLEDAAYLVLRAMRGGSLADRLRDGPLPIADALRAARDVAAALAHAHTHGVVHRDVKPDNIWLDGEGAAALGDFGVAHSAGAERLTADGAVVGTTAYVSPEQIRGDEPGAASDLYALGITLYELIAGRTPFAGADPIAVFAQHMAAAPPPPSVHVPDLPPEVERLVLALLAKAPAQRPASAGDVVAALDALVAAAGEPGAAGSGARRLLWVVAAQLADADAEALHAHLRRGRAAIAEHGGAVAAASGDALVGLFGAAGAHDDDARNAVRAALALCRDTASAGVGIETGEAFVAATAGAGPIATGATVGTASRLAQRAAAGEILAGPAARTALAGDARVEAATGRVLGLRRRVPALLHPPESPFVDREAQRDALAAAFAEACAERACGVVTLAGPAGIGKSRLAGEFVGRLGDGATVLAGACEPSGEGSGMRVLDDLLRGIGGDDPAPRLTALLDGDERAVSGLLGAVGRSPGPVRPEETAWALRRVLERLAQERPVVIAVEDLHWADDALLDLLDQVAALSVDAPMLVLGLARAELLERRPTWAAPQRHRTVILLDALEDEHARELARRLGAGDRHAGRIAGRAEGNPLFVEQLVAVDPGSGELELPLSIQAVLGRRIDGLAPGERALLQRAAVEGRTFHVGALQALMPGADGGLHGRLVDLVRQGLLAGDHPLVPGEDAFRFTHALIREAAYAGLSKRVRADLHTTLAGWLGARDAIPDETVAHHLERACHLHAELGRADAEQRDLAARAAGRLQSAADAALDRGDPSAAAALLERATAVVAADPPARAALLGPLGAALFAAGRLTDAAGVLDEAITTAPARWLRARAEVERAFLRLETGAPADAGPATTIAADARAVLRREGDLDGESRAWSLHGQGRWTAGCVAEADDAWQRAARCAEEAGDRREHFAILGWRATAAVLGPLPAPDAIALCDELRDTVAASPVAVVWMLNPLASLHAMRAAFDTALALIAEANATLHQLGSLGASVSHHEALVHLLAGDAAAAEVPLRAGVAKLASMEDHALLATTAAMLAQAVVQRGADDEATELCALAADAAAADDLMTQALWRSVAAQVLARGGREARAVTLAREAVALLEPTDLLSHRADAMLVLADVLHGASRPVEAAETARAALTLYERKGNVVGAGRARMLSNDEDGG